MRAARFHGRGDIRIDDVPEPDLRPGTVKVRVEWCGICGTDLHEYVEGPLFCPTTIEPHPLTGEVSPVVLGHEFAGSVVEVAAGVEGLSVGDRVAVEPRIVCRDCPACLADHHNCCQHAATIGLQGGGGGLAEFAVVSADLAHPLGDLGSDIGALVEPLSVAVHAVRRAGQVGGQVAVVFGGGPIGLLITAVLRASGARCVVMVEPHSNRRDRGVGAGADVVVDPTVEDVRDHIAKLTDGSGADVVFECVGAGPVLTTCLEVVKAHGTVVNVGIASGAVEVDLLPLVLKEVTLVGTICYNNDHPRAIEMLRSAGVDVEQFITKRVGLDDLVPGGLESLLDPQGNHVKILVSPHA